MHKKEQILILLGGKISYYRKNKGFSQENLGFLINSATNYIGCIERGEKCPSLKVLKKIADVLEVQVKDFIDF